jgi:hypothetical protein
VRPAVLAIIAASLIGLVALITPSTITGSVPTHCVAVGLLPDPKCTPGSTYSRVTQANIQTTICKAGWTATIRPPVSYTSKLKRQQMTQYGFTDSISNHEEDHLIPLELAGNPADPKNLWPEPDASPNRKDAVENELRRRVCSGRMTLKDAQQRIARDWTTSL